MDVVVFGDGRGEVELRRRSGGWGELPGRAGDVPIGARAALKPALALSHAQLQGRI